MSYEKRSMAMSVVQNFLKIAQWNNWTTDKAVKDGYKASGWVYRAVSLISRNIASVDWVVVDVNGKKVPTHPVHKALQRPCKAFDKQDFFELLSAWQQLSGEAYIKKVYDSRNILSELHPVSPDRIAPIPSNEAGELVSGYEIKNEAGSLVKTQDYTIDNVIPLLFLDPANPTRGIGPLQVAAKSVDTDNEQKTWNKSAMENRGVLDGIFSFKETLSKDAFDTIRERIKELFTGSKNARVPGVIGGDASYTRLALTPVEMDFLESRKFNREEIFIIFGVPPQLAGVQDFATYNNYQSSLRIFWLSTLIPILDDIKSSLNSHLEAELGQGFLVDYDVSKIEALKENAKEKADLVKIYADMGIPVQQLNEMFKLGVPEYVGWDKPKQMSQQQQPMAVNKIIGKIEKRSIEDNVKDAEKLAVTHAKAIEAALLQQQQAVFSALENGGDIEEAIQAAGESLKTAIETHYKTTALHFAKNVIINGTRKENRAEATDLESAIAEMLANETTILIEKSLIDADTITKILDAVVAGEAAGSSIATIQQAIFDTGLFKPDRALTISRTISGTAQSLGQIAGAKSANASKKTWHTSGAAVRPAHTARSGETVAIDGYFSQQLGGKPRYPCDQQTSAADRINCRCSMTFEY